MERGKEMEPLPNDLIVEIFSRLPSKSVARFCTLSKHWASKLRSQDFAELFLARSSTRPRLLFAVEQFRYNRWQFFSTPQNHRYENSSHLEFHSKFIGDISPRYICSYASGLFYFPKVQILDEEAPLICNPITGLYVRLPYLERYRKSRGFLGFDPIGKQFKVMSEATGDGQWEHHNILTLGTGELIWRSNRTTEDGRSLTEGICINGILYFLARMYSAETTDTDSMIVCFDVRAEEFNFVKAEWFNDNLYGPWGLRSDPTDLILVNYKGKLGGIEWKRADAGGRLTVELCVWVLEDVEKQEWVNYVYSLPENEVLSSCNFSVAGVTTTGNIVLAMNFTCKPYYVFYFDPERNTLQSVEIQGFGADLETVEDRGQVHVYVDHVEDLSVNNPKQLQSNISHIRSICACCKAKEAQGQQHESHHKEA